MDMIGEAAAVCGDNPASFRGSCAEMSASRVAEAAPPGWVAPSVRVVQAQPTECRETTRSLKNLVARFSGGYRSKWSCNSNVRTCRARGEKEGEKHVAFLRHLFLPPAW